MCPFYAAVSWHMGVFLFDIKCVHLATLHWIFISMFIHCFVILPFPNVSCSLLGIVKGNRLQSKSS